MKRKIISLTLCFAFAVSLFSACSAGGLFQSWRYKISRDLLELKIGDGFDLDIVGASLTDGDMLSVEWTSSDEKTATVDDGGFVVGVGEGKAVITASVKSIDGSEEKINTSYKCNVSVLKNGIVLEKFGYIDKDIEIVKGQSLSPRMTVYPGNADNKTYTLTSSNENVVKIENGKICGVSEGTAVVTAATTDGRFTSELNVIVSSEKNLVTRFVLNKSALSMSKGDEEQLSALVTPSNLGLEITWNSSDTTVASVSKKGVVVAKKEGTAVITATIHDIMTDKKATCTVKVSKNVENVPAEDITFDAGDTMNISVGDTTVHNFGANVYPSNTSDVLSWSTSSSDIKLNSATGNFTLLPGTSEGTQILLTCTAGNVRKTVLARVVKQAQKEAKLTASKTDGILIGDTVILTIEAEDDVKVTAPSDLTHFVLVSGSGKSWKIKAVSAGKEEITFSVKSEKGEDYKINSITLSVSQGSGDFKVKASSLNLEVEETSSDWFEGSTSGIVFESSNSSVAKVNIEGKITAISAGNATVYAKKDGKTVGLLKVAVSDSSEDVTYDLTSSASSISGEGSVTLTASSSEEIISTSWRLNKKNSDISLSDNGDDTATLEYYGTATGTVTVYCDIETKYGSETKSVTISFSPEE